MTPKVLLTGPAWFGDLLVFCERGLRELGCDVRTIAVNRAPWLEQAERRRSRVQMLPWLGPKLGFRLERRERRRLGDAVNREVRTALDEWRPTLLLALLSWRDPIDAETLGRCGNVPRVGWLMDDPFLDDGSLATRMAAYDRLYVIDESWAAPVRLTTGLPVETLACGADPQSFFRVQPERVDPALRSRVLFVGSSYQGVPAGVMRHRLLTEVADLGLKVFGDPGWRSPGVDRALAGCYQGRGLDTAGCNLAYNGADVAINIHHPQFRAGTSLRTFAICAAGAFQLVDWRPGIERYFEPDAELVCYTSPADLREKVARYLADEPARRRIAAAGMARALREHTYAARLGRILRDAQLLRP